MMFLRSNTAVIISVGPFYDKTDGVTIETALTITNERITLVAETDAGSAPTNILDNVTGATSGTANDLNYITGNDAGMMQLELAAADVNRVGRMRLSITDAANHAPVFHEIFVLPQAIFDWLTGVIVPLPSNMTQILGTAVSAPATAGILDVNLKNIANATVSTSSAQLGVNVVNAGATAWGSGAITAGSIAAAAMNGKGDWNVGKTGYSLTQTFPSNFSSLAITAGGAVTVGTNNDKTGYTASTVSDKTGYALTSAYDPAKTAAQAGDAMTLSAAYDAAKTAATQASVNTVDTVVDAVKVQTDKLTFTVANQIDANIQSVNDVTVQGTGAVGDEWNP